VNTLHSYWLPSGEEDKKTRRQEDKKTRRQEDKKTRRQEDKKTRRQEDKKTFTGLLIYLSTYLPIYRFTIP